MPRARATASLLPSLSPEATPSLAGARGLGWQALSEQFGEGGNVGITGRKKSMRFLKALQGTLRGRTPYPVSRARIVPGAFQLALQTFDKVRRERSGALRMRLGWPSVHGGEAARMRLKQCQNPQEHDEKPQRAW